MWQKQEKKAIPYHYIPQYIRCQVVDVTVSIEYREKTKLSKLLKNRTSKKTDEGD